MLGMPVLGHFPQTLTAQETLSSGLDMVAHSGAYLWKYFSNNLNTSVNTQNQAVQATLNAGASVTATVGIEEIVARIWCGNTQGINDYWARPETRYMHPTTVNLNNRSITSTRRWNPNGCLPGSYNQVTAFIMQFTKLLHEAGVPLLMGTDSPTVLGVPGFSAVDEVQSLVNSGIPLIDALRIATWNGGQFISGGLDLDVPFGSIREGWRADMLMLGSNPLEQSENLEDIVGVMARGRWKSNTWFEIQLEAIADLYQN